MQKQKQNREKDDQPADRAMSANSGRLCRRPAYCTAFVSYFLYILIFISPKAVVTKNDNKINVRHVERLADKL